MVQHVGHQLDACRSNKTPKPRHGPSGTSTWEGAVLADGQAGDSMLFHGSDMYSPVYATGSSLLELRVAGQEIEIIGADLSLTYILHVPVIIL